MTFRWFHVNFMNISNIRCGHFKTCLILLQYRGVRTRVFRGVKTRFCPIWTFCNCYLLAALHYCKTVFSSLFGSGNSSPYVWGEVKHSNLRYFRQCSIERHCYLLQHDWEWSKSGKTDTFRWFSWLFGVSRVEVVCHESLGLRGCKTRFCQWNTENTEIHRINDFSCISSNLTDVLTCVFRVF